MAATQDAAFFCLPLADIPDALYQPDAPVAEWLKHVHTAGPEGFAPGSLGRVAPIAPAVLLERSIVYPLYMVLNAAPFLLPPVVWAAVGAWGALGVAAILVGVHALCLLRNPMRSIREGQFILTERNVQKYHSMRWVWPKSLHPPNLPGPKIFCAIPHGLAPIGVVGYPFWSRVFEQRLCRWTCAPVVLKLPIIGYFLKMVGYVAATAPNIRQVLQKREESVGVVLDGIAGMFQTDSRCERGFVRERKGIVKIALTTGAPLVPVYCFGTSSLWRILVDPFGLLERISVALNVSVTPFFGRPFGLMPFGPPFRNSVMVAIGDPIVVPRIEQPTQEQVDEYHRRLMEGFVRVFEQHRAAYGWSDRELKLV